jgi:hypothetical protein
MKCRPCCTVKSCQELGFQGTKKMCDSAYAELVQRSKLRSLKKAYSPGSNCAAGLVQFLFEGFGFLMPLAFLLSNLARHS